MKIPVSIVGFAILALVVVPLQGQQQTEPQKKPTASGTAQPSQAPTDAAKTGQDDEQWTVLFGGKEMKGWVLPKGFDYDEAGKVEVKDGTMVLHGGAFATGVRWPGKFPQNNYEIALDAQRAAGYDFFCGMSFPVGDGALTLILGGWGGTLTGLSCVDGYRADENETAGFLDVKTNTWYRVRVRVTDTLVTAYVDDAEICKLERENRKLTVTTEMEPCLPFGIATWGNTTGVLRNIRYRMLSREEIAGGK